MGDSRSLALRQGLAGNVAWKTHPRHRGCTLGTKSAPGARAAARRRWRSSPDPPRPLDVDRFAFYDLRMIKSFRSKQEIVDYH